MSSSESETNLSQGWSEPPADESEADKIRRNDKSLTRVELDDWDGAVEILDALKTNSVVKEVFIFDRPHLFLLLHQVNHYLAFIKLLQVIKINKSVECLLISLSRGGLLRGSRFATMVTSDG